MNMKETVKRVIPTSIIEYRRRLILASTRKKQISSISMSQAGQDCWVYGEVFNEAENGFFLDIGAHEGVSLSNTFILETRYNWRGICIEGNPNTFPYLQMNRSCRCINICVDSQDGVVAFALRGVMSGIISDDCDNIDKEENTVEVTTTMLEKILIQENAPSLIDYLSIDIEGAEDRALLGFPFSDYMFNCMTIERPSEKLRNVLKSHGYILIKEIPGLDCFYIHSDFKKRYIENTCLFGSKKFLTRRWN